jgi:hypothetical protein
VMKDLPVKAGQCSSGSRTDVKLAVDRSWARTLQPAILDKLTSAATANKNVCWRLRGWIPVAPSEPDDNHTKRFSCSS